MKALSQAVAVRSLQGFEVYHLGNEEVELAVVPELGAKIISLKDLRTGREWMSHPPGGLKLFRNNPGDDFSQSPLAGMDECLPTIAPCSWRGRELPDHGEVWSAPWQVDAAAREAGSLKTSVRLKISPLEFHRTIELRGNEVQISYELVNRGTMAERFLWATHPLLRLQAGDRLELPASSRALLNGADWLDAIASAVPPKKFAKVFAAPVSEGLAAVCNPASGDRLEFAWSPLENDTLGVWLTRGGWHGHHHFALEPTNAADDSLALAVERSHCGTVPARDSVGWQIQIRVGA